MWLSLLTNKFVWLGLLALALAGTGKLYLNARDKLATERAEHESELHLAAQELAQVKQDRADAEEYAANRLSDYNRSMEALDKLANMQAAEHKKNQELRKRLAEAEASNEDLAHCLSLELDSLLPEAGNDSQNSSDALAPTPGTP